MKTFAIAAVAAGLLSGIALTSPSAEAVPFGRHAGNLTAKERAAIARSERQLNVLKWRVRADGRVSVWELAQVRLAQVRHDRLVYRYRHN